MHSDRSIGSRMQSKMDTITFNRTNAANTTIDTSQFEVNYEAIVTSLICSVGIVGNISNIAVLRLKRTHTGLDHVGRAAILGLLALACSDLMFCVVGVVSGLFVAMASGDMSTGKDASVDIAVLGFISKLYRGACLNIFLFISTWCITLLSVERYLVVCHPFSCRQFVSTRSVVVSRLAVCVLSLIINLPLFLRFQVIWEVCENNLRCTYAIPNVTKYRMPLMMFHWISWALVGTFLPLVLLLIANAKLVCEVTRVKKHKECRQNEKAMFRVTKTLVVIASSYIVLVCPSMLLDFLYTHSLVAGDDVYQVAVIVGNICQAIQFSCNFLLYCTINKAFRPGIC